MCKVLLDHDPAIALDDARFLAAQNGHLPVIKVLLEHKNVAIAKRELVMKRSILAALWNDRLDSLRYLASYCTKMAQPVEVQYDGLPRVGLVNCLIYSGLLRVDDRSYGYSKAGRSGTLLHLAVEHSDFDLASYLVQHKSFESSILERNCWWDSYLGSDYKTALDFAQFRGQTEIASLLIAHGAINHSIAPKIPLQIEQNPAQPYSPKSAGDLEMQDLSESDINTDTDTDTDS